MSRQRAIGFLINPIAGMGGRVGLKGTDNVYEEAVRRGAKPVSPLRAKMFLDALSNLINGEVSLEFITCRGVMGGGIIGRYRDFKYVEIDIPRGAYTTRMDTINAVKSFIDGGVELILFVGGDGTARDIAEVLINYSPNTPMLGIPSGVKMYSGVFGYTPADSALILYEYLKGNARIVEREVADVDEDHIRRDIINLKIYGYVKTLIAGDHLQSMKSPTSIGEDESISGIAKYFIENMESNAAYIFGPGSTIKKIVDGLGVDKTILGIDLYYKGRIYKDLDEGRLYKLINEINADKIYIVVTPIGGQGVIFGRGNQQISPKIIKAVGRENIIIVASRRKLSGIQGGVLRVDTDDEKVNNILRGYMRVLVDYGEWRLVRVV